MTQIITGSGLGCHGSSLDQLGGYGPKGVATLGQGGESVYVNGANGNLVLKQSDGFLATTGIGLDIFQVYNSQSAGGGSWRFNTDSSLSFEGAPNTAGSSVKRIEEDGHCSRFIYDEAHKAYLAEDGSTTRLSFRNDCWEYREGSSHTSYLYNTQGQLTSLSDRDGHMLRFSYQNGQLASISDSSGKQTVTWSFSQGLLSDVTWVSDDNTLHHLHYTYDAHNRLSKVSRDLGQGKTYWISYEYAGDSNLISSIHQSDGTTLHIDYDAEGRVKRLLDGEGRTTSYQYLDGKTILTNGLGEAWTYFYDTDARLTGIDGPENLHIRYHYEGKHLSEITQGKLHWQFSYNNAGDCVRIETPEGSIILRTYDSEHRLLSETRYQLFDGDYHPQKPLTTRFIYDELGHLRFEISADGTLTEHRYDDLGLRISSRCYLSSRLDTNHLQTDQTVTQDDLITWCQKQAQQNIRLVDYHYDWRGNLDEEIHYLQINEQGEGILTIDALRTFSRYDAAGRLVEKSGLTSSGELSTTHYFYDDLGRLIKTIDNQQHEQTIDYDDAHHRTIKTDANGLQTIYTYDQSGLLLSTQRLDGGHQYGTIAYRYDAAGRLIAETNVEGKTSYSFYDHKGRLIGTVSGSGQVVEYLYDDEDHCIKTHQYQQTIDTHNLQSTALEWALIKPKTANQDRISHVVYNAYHQIAYQIDAHGAVIGCRYDAQGHVIAKTAYANRLPSPLLMSDIPPTTSNDDRTITYYYDAEGRLQAEINAEGSATSYQYNNAGQLVAIRRYANKVGLTRAGDWSLDAPTSTNKDIHTYRLYNAAGLKIADIDAEGYLTQYRYDARGLLTDTIAYYTKIQSPFNDNSSLEEIRPILHANDHHTTYCYNDLNQLIEEKSQSGLVITYAYDEQGLVISKTSTDSKTHNARQQRYRYDALGRVIQSLDELGTARLQQNSLLSLDQIEDIWQQHSVRYTYDMAGHLISKTNALNQTSRYFYNDSGLVSYTLSATGAATETRYNAFNQIETTIQYSANWFGNEELNTQKLAQYLNAATDARFDKITHYEYNSLGLVISKRQGSAGKLSTTYNVFGEVEQTVQQIGLYTNTITNYQYDRVGLLRHRTEDISGINKTFEAQYDAFGRMEKSLDGRNGATIYTLNQRGEQLRIDTPGNDHKVMFYDAFGRILSVKDKTDMSYTYDDQNNTLTIAKTNTSSNIVTTFNAFGDKITVTDSKQQTTSYQYDAKGQLIHVDAPEKSSTTYQYDAEGHLVFQQNASGHIMRYTYDAEGQVLTKVIDPEGANLTTSYTYDGIGRQLQVIENGQCTQFSYDNQGNLIKKCLDPNGLNLITEFSYTENGLLARQTTYNPQGTDKVIAYEWDALGRCLATLIDPDGLKLTTTYEYDNNDNLIAQTDANQHRTQYVYDANNRVRFHINARGVVTEHCYNAQGNEIQTITYNNRITALDHCDEKSLMASIQADDSADHYQFFTYDNQSRLIQSYDGLGYASRYTYDANDNVIEKTLYANPASLSALKSGHLPPIMASTQDRTIYFAYDGLNRQRFQIDANERITEYRYDASGQLIAQTGVANPLSNLSNDYSLDYVQKHIRRDINKDQNTQYAYDMAGRMRLQASAQGAITSYVYDDAGNAIATTQYATKLSREQLAEENWSTLITKSQNDRTTRAVFDAAGREIYRISPAGKTVERCYDALGNVITEIAHAKSLSLTSYRLQSIKAALGENTSSDHLTRYQFDVAGRLLQKTDADNHSTQYTYDNADNVATKTDANGALWTYHYDEANQLIETLSPKTTFSTYKNGTWAEETRAIITRNQYDSFGNLITAIRDAEGINQTIQYTYDGNNRKLDTIYPNRSVNTATQKASSDRQEEKKTLSETNRYNAFGELIAARDRSDNWRHWTYDRVGHMMFALNAENALTKYQYDAFDNISMKTTYANRLTLSGNIDEDLKKLEVSKLSNDNDRHDNYLYDKDNRLIESRKNIVNSYDGRTGEYHRLSPTSRLSYNAFGELITSETKLSDTDWAITRHYYSVEGLKTATLDAQGYLSTYTYNEFGLLDSEIQYAERAGKCSEEHVALPSTNKKDRNVSFLYNALGQLTSKTLKQATYQQLTGAGSSYKTVTNDLTSRYAYDAMGNLVSTTDAMGNTAYSYYNESGQLTARLSASVSTGRPATTYRYDALGQLIESRQWAGGAIAADEEHYTLKGASNSDILLKDVYDIDGHLIVQVDGTGHLTNYSYDANGNIARSWQVLTQADKTLMVQDKRYTYDAENRLTHSATFKANGQCATDDATYNAFGEVEAKGINGVMSTKIDYDLAGRVWRSNLQGYFQIYMYDLADHVTQVITSTNAYGTEYHDMGVDLSNSNYDSVIDFNKDTLRFDLQRQDNIYDALGRLLIQTKDGTTSASDKDKQTPVPRASQRQQLDRWGNTITHTNANNHTTEYDYNIFDQLVKQDLPEVSVVDEHGAAKQLRPTIYHAYDALGRAIAMTDANGHTVAKVLDAEGRTTQEIDALGHHRDKHYNLLGQLDTSTNERGGITSYAYDKANRLVSITTSKTKQSYDYDGAGQLIKQTDGQANVTQYTYDSLGHQTSRTQAGHTTTYGFDDAGHKTSERDANGQTQSWVYDTNGRVQEHIDLGGHRTSYIYNTNGLLLNETSTAGKNIDYHYFSDGRLQQYVDKGHEKPEVMDYTYDAEGQVLSKISSRGGSWIVERDAYEYDALGRLVKVRRRNPDDYDPANPNKDHALLSIDYEYDAASNIRATHVDANYTNYQHTTADDYFLYDDNNRMIINKGQLQNGQIQITKTQGSALSYDDTGNINSAQTYENNLLTHYNYQYNHANQLEKIRKNNLDFQTKSYDAAGNVASEQLYNKDGLLTQRNMMAYDKGLLITQRTEDANKTLTNETHYQYDAMGNLIRLTSSAPEHDNNAGYTQTHTYNYELWDSYQQKTDYAELAIKDHATTYGTSERTYDINGQLQKAVDNNGQNTTNYLTSSIEGIKARSDKDGQTNYLTVNGKTLGDLRLNNNGTQKLDVYAGFTPMGTPATTGLVDDYLKNNPKLNQCQQANFFNSDEGRAMQKANDGTLPQAPQDNLGSYTLQTGDTLESIALQVYGDSSLWYLLADANGVTDRNTHVGEKGGQLHPGQRLNIPPAAGMHHTNNTHKVISSSDWLGNTNATTPLPPTPPPPKNHTSFWKSIVIGVVMAVVTVLTAGVLGLLTGAIEGIASIGGIMGAGSSLLAGGASTTASLGIGFAAGFVGNIAAQGAANALGLQKGIDLQGALITGLATAATATVGHLLSNTSGAYKSITNAMDAASPNAFNISSAAVMMEKDALSQGINLAIRGHQKFDWLELSISAASAGFMAGKPGQQMSKALNQIDHNTGILSSELQSLTTGAATSAANGNHFDAAQVLTENLGSALGNTLVQASTAWTDPYEGLTYLSDLLKSWVGKEEIQRSDIKEGGFCSIPNDDLNYSALPNEILNDDSAYSSISEVSFSNISDIWQELNEKYESNIDFSALSSFEGGQIPQSYLLMDKKGNVIGQSGITIATGFDIGQHSVDEIKSYGFTKTLEKKLLPFADAKKECAKELLSLARETKFSNEELNQIDFVVQGHHLDLAIKSWNANRLENTPLFKDLSSSQQTVLLSRTYHQGPSMPDTMVAKKFYGSAINNNWIAAENHLRNYNVSAAYYINRVHREANYLKTERS